MQGHQKSSLTASLPWDAGGAGPGPPLMLTHIQHVEVSTETQQTAGNELPGEAAGATAPDPAPAPTLCRSAAGSIHGLAFSCISKMGSSLYVAHATKEKRLKCL